MAKIFGGSASRLEVYALFVAAVVLIGGGIGGAIVVSSSDSKPAEVAQVSVDTTVVDTTVVDATVEANAGSTATITASQPTTQSGLRTEQENSPSSATTLPLCADFYRGCGSPPVTASDESKPVEDASTYCTMPNINGVHNAGSHGAVIGAGYLGALVYTPSDCPFRRVTSVNHGMEVKWRFCTDPDLVISEYRIFNQYPAAGTLVDISRSTVTFDLGISSSDPWYSGEPCIY